MATRITAVYANHDILQPTSTKIDGFENHVVVTDNPNLDVYGWETQYVPQGMLEPRLAAKHPKMLPFTYTNDDLVVWTDAAIQLNDTYLHEQAQNSAAAAITIMKNVTPNPKKSIVTEYNECYWHEKYLNYKMQEQVIKYLEDGLPQDFGVYGAGIIAWHKSQEAMEVGALWFTENIRWSPQDQISLPWVLWKTQIPFSVWLEDINFHDNKHFSWKHHNREHWSSK